MFVLYHELKLATVLSRSIHIEVAMCTWTGSWFLLPYCCYK